MAPAGAASSFRRAVELNPSDEQSRLALAEISLDPLGDFEEASIQLEALIKMSPDNSLANARMGDVLVAEGKFDRARSVYERSLELNDEDCHTHNSYAVLISELGEDPTMARRHWERALEIEDGFAQAHFNLGTCLWKDFGDLIGARDHLLKSIELSSGSVESHNHLAIVLQELGDAKGALNHYKKALKLDKKNSYLHQNLANFHLTVDRDFEQARIHFVAALSNGLDTPEIHYNLGILMTQVVGDYRSGRTHFERCLELNPQDESSHLQLAKIYEENFADPVIAQYHRSKAKKIGATEQ
jgi:tetratricopeptide (TPR) repeat protein